MQNFGDSKMTQNIEDYRYTIEKHVAITAGAGTGKTYTLSRRYINALLGFDFYTLDKRLDSIYIDLDSADAKSAKPTEIVTTTFTEAGAMEMRSRIEWLISLMLGFLNDVDAVVQNSEEREIKELLLLLSDEQKSYVENKLQYASTTVYLSIISTIHSFAIAIINKNTELVPMDTTIDVIDETIKGELFEKLWFEVSNENEDIYLQIDREYSLYNAKEFTKKYIFDKRVRDGFDEFVNEIDNYTGLNEIYLKLFFEQNIQKILDAFSEYDAVDKKAENFEQVLEVYFNSLFNLKGESLVDLADVKRSAKGYTAINKVFNELVSFNKEDDFKTLIVNIHTILSALRQKYVAELKKEARLDFDRLLELASELLDDERASINEYKYFFVDEFQDTNLFQWEIVKKASKLKEDKCANIFLVGDEKQSIFEFQGAEVSTFRLAIEDIISLKGKDSIVEPKMSINYRSDDEIIEFVNEIFQKAMSEQNDKIPQKVEFKNPIINKFLDKVYSDYLDVTSGVKDECEVKYHHLEAHSKDKGLIKLLIKNTKLSEEAKLAVAKGKKPKLEGYGSSCMAEHEAYMIADFIAKIKAGKKSEYSDIKEQLDKNEKSIAILCDAKTNMLKMKDALKRVGLDSKVSASEDFYKTDEIVEIYHILAMCEYLKDANDLSIRTNPENDMVIAKANNQAKQRRFFLSGGMRTNAFKFSDRDILEHIDANKIPREIKKLISLQSVLNLGEFIDYIVEHYEVKRVYAHLEDYPQVKANLKKITKIAYDFMPVYETPLKEFVEMLQGACLEDESAKEDQAFYESEQTNSIEIRTMHSSKGLSWPMVIVPELGRSLQGKNQTLKYATYKNEDEKLSVVGFSIDGAKTIASSVANMITEQKKYAEKKRLLYVAMTRPENHLVLSTTTDATEGFIKNSYWSRWLNLDIEKKDNTTTIDIEDNDMVDKIHNFRSDSVDIEIYEKRLKGLDTQPKCGLPSIPMFENIFEIRDENIETLREKNEDIKINDPFKFSKSATFGTAVHLLLELGYKDKIFNTSHEADYIENFIKKETVSDRKRLLKAVENFKKSEVFEDLQNSEMVRFEEEFNFYDKETNSIQKRFIDLLYLKYNKYNIIDFKSNKLDEIRTREMIIKEHDYDEQLKGYYDYIASRFGEENINFCGILWLDDGSISDLKPNNMEDI